jgi:hypothetical protein
METAPRVCEIWGGFTMTPIKLIVGVLAAMFASVAFAGPGVPLGTPVGSVLGTVLGIQALGGTVVGQVLPIVGGGVFLIAAASLALGIYIVRRKQK